MVTTDTFRMALIQIFNEAQTKKLPFIEIRSGDLHTSLGASARMPSCCHAMRGLCDSEDVIVRTPPKGNGANLVIRYHLPRNNVSIKQENIQKPAMVQIPQENSINKKISTLSVYCPEISELNNLEQLQRVDPESAMLKIRKVTEKISQRICENKNLPSKKTKFDELCFTIADNQLLSKKSVNYLHSIRKMGNVSAHPQDSDDEKITDTDVMIVTNALIAIVEEAHDRKLI